MLASLGRHADAVTCFDRAIALEPLNATALTHRGVALHAIGRYEDALRDYDRALAVDPDRAETLANRAAVLHAMLRFEGALASCDAALRISPDHVEALANRGAALLGLNCNEAALASFERALARDPNNGNICNSRGGALVMLGRLDDAVRNFEQASTLAPENVNALTNLGNTLSMLGRVEEALQSFKRAQDVVPGHAEAHFAESLCRLSVGDFERGWHQYEWRWKLRAARRDLTQPLWLGDTEIAGRTILLHAEQGLGDTLQFCRYATLIAAETKVVIEVPKPLVRLLSTLPGVSHVVACGDPLPEFDLHCPLLSLPLALGTTVATVPNQIPYLCPDPVQVAAWRQRVADLPGIGVGLVWSGASRLEVPELHQIDRRRSTKLEQFAPLGELPGISLVSLQKGDGAAQARRPPPELAIADWTEI